MSLRLGGDGAITGCTSLAEPALTLSGLTVDTDTLVVDSANSRVGIGTSSPIYPLHVSSEAGIELYDGTGGGNVLNLRPSLGDSNKFNMSISSFDHSGGGVGPADGLSINGFDGVSVCTGSSTSRQERMRIDSAGNVGINTSNPAGVLNIQTNTATGPSLTYDSANILNLDYGTVQLAAGIDPSSPFGSYLQSRDNTNGARTLNLNPAGGNVGVGTSSPAVELDVAGEIRASSGILFGTDTAAANSLDDYEEGTWTPTLTDALTYTQQEGQYTKIGNFVYIQARIQVATFTSTSNSAIISGLPFTAASSTSTGGFGSAYFGFGTLSTDVTSNEIALLMPVNTNTIELRGGGSRTSPIAVNNSIITYTRSFIICGSYRVA